MTDRLTALKQTKLFGNVSESALTRMLSDDGVCEITASKGETVAQTDKSLMLILSGRAYRKNGGAVMRHFKQGDIFGAATLFSDEGAESEIIAESDCAMLKISEGAVRNLFAADSARAVNYIAFLTGRIHYLNGLIDVYTGADAEKSLMFYLLRVSRQKGNTFTLNLSATAKELNIGRASLYRALDGLVNSGAIAKDGKNITILNKKSLQENTEK